MRRTLLLLALPFLGFTASAQLQRIVVQGTGAPQVFTDITSALTAAQSGDKLYLSGGTFSSATPIVFDKQLHVIGAGMGPDSSAVTGITVLSTEGTNDILLTTAASGSTFTGIRFDPGQYFQYGTSDADDDPTGVIFERCTFDTRLIADNGTNGSSSTLFLECIFHSFLYGADGTSATLERCILDHQAGTGAEISGFSNGLIMRHCIGLGTRVGNSDNCIIENCIFTRTSAPFWQSNGATLTNNLLVSTSLVSNMGGFVSTDNVLGVPVTDIFINEDNADFEWTDDLHLQPSSVGIGMASDGTEVGIYGTSSPFKEGAVPFNPHYRSATIDAATNANGDLPVNIRVAAQTY